MDFINTAYDQCAHDMLTALMSGNGAAMVWTPGWGDDDHCQAGEIVFEWVGERPELCSQRAARLVGVISAVARGDIGAMTMADSLINEISNWHAETHAEACAEALEIEAREALEAT